MALLFLFWGIFRSQFTGAASLLESVSTWCSLFLRYNELFVENCTYLILHLHTVPPPHFVGISANAVLVGENWNDGTPCGEKIYAASLTVLTQYRSFTGARTDERSQRCRAVKIMGLLRFYHVPIDGMLLLKVTKRAAALSRTKNSWRRGAEEQAQPEQEAAVMLRAARARVTWACAASAPVTPTPPPTDRVVSVSSSSHRTAQAWTSHRQPSTKDRSTAWRLDIPTGCRL